MIMLYESVYMYICIYNEWLGKKYKAYNVFYFFINFVNGCLHDMKTKMGEKKKRSSTTLTAGGWNGNGWGRKKFPCLWPLIKGIKQCQFSKLPPQPCVKSQDKSNEVFDRMIREWLL
jgi:hypothetical protein